MDQPLISIIVPIYKVEAYLHRCVDSILQQSYRNLEIILVDDGSPDKCPGICDSYLPKDSRIQVVHKKNGGLSDARNAGLNAKQKAIQFYNSIGAVKILRKAVLSFLNFTAKRYLFVHRQKGNHQALLAEIKKRNGEVYNAHTSVLNLSEKCRAKAFLLFPLSFWIFFKYDKAKRKLFKNLV